MLLIEDRRCGNQRPYRLAVLAAEAALVRFLHSPAPPLKSSPIVGQIFIEHEVCHQPAGHFLAGIAEHVDHSGVDKGGLRIRPEPPDSFGGRVHDTAVFGFAFLQIAIHQHGRQTVRQPASNLLEQSLLFRCPVPHVGTLMQAELPWTTDLGTDGHGHTTLVTETLGIIGRQWVFRTGAEFERPLRLQQGLEFLRDIAAHRNIDTELEDAGVFRFAAFHRNAPGRSPGVAWIEQECPVAIEGCQHDIEHIAHHLLRIMCSLYRPVDPVHALEKMQIGLALLLSLLALSNVGKHGKGAVELMYLIENWGC